MMTLLKTAFFITLLATLLSLVAGLGLYFLGGDLNHRYANRAMQTRVICQGLALLLFLCVLLLQ